MISVGESKIIQSSCIDVLENNFSNNNFVRFTYSVTHHLRELIQIAQHSIFSLASNKIWGKECPLNLNENTIKDVEIPHQALKGQITKTTNAITKMKALKVKNHTQLWYYGF